MLLPGISLARSKFHLPSSAIVGMMRQVMPSQHARRIPANVLRLHDCKAWKALLFGLKARKVMSKLMSSRSQAMVARLVLNWSEIALVRESKLSFFHEILFRAAMTFVCLRFFLSCHEPFSC